jgi:hypothetical protein
MSNWIRIGIALSGLWSLLLLGAVQQTAREVGVTYYLWFLFTSLAVGWLLGFMVFCTVRFLTEERKVERDARTLKDTDFEK